MKKTPERIVVSLTKAQVACLRKLAAVGEMGSFQLDAGSSTLSTLRKLGYITKRIDRTGGHQSTINTITDAGRAVLALVSQ